MKKITAIIVDDEKGVRDLLRLLLQKHCPEVSILSEASNAETAFEQINEAQPDLIFLDVQMPKSDGFALLNKFEQPRFDVIFTTSYSEYAIPAIKANAVDYLLKPYDITELKTAVQKVIQKRTLLNKTDAPELFIQVHKNEKVVQINAKDVMYFEANNNYTLIAVNDGAQYLAAKLLADYEELIKPLNTFLRINRSVIVNSYFIKTYSKIAPFIITLTNDQTFEISRRKRAEIIEVLRNK